MKFLAVLFLAGLAVAAAFPVDYDFDEFHAQSSIGDRMREAFENLVERIKKAVEEGKGFRGDWMKKAEDIYNKLKNMGVELSEKIKQTFEDLRSRFGRSSSVAHGEMGVLEVFKKLRELMKSKLDADTLKAKVEKLFGKGSEMAENIINMLKEKGEKGKKKILDWIDRVLPDKEQRSLEEYYDKLRDYFRDLNLNLRERFTRFGEWVKDKYHQGLEKGKTRAENIRRIAREFIDDTRAIGKDMAEEAMDFFREYKKDLGHLYDEVVDKARQITKS